MKPLTQLEQDAKWATGLKYEDIPSDVLYLVKFQIANILAATIAGSLNSSGSNTHTGLMSTQSIGKNSVIPHGISSNFEVVKTRL
jgi:hypothetical protein